MAALSLLPNEILALITAHLDGPRDVLHISLTNRRLAEFVKLDGWKALLKGRFGLSGLDSDARNTVHGLTTLYKNWSRKGFLARYLEPTIKVTSLNTWSSQEWRGPRGQTMGYQPCVDSFEDIFGAWNERREVLAWSAGTQIVIRIKESGKSAKMLWEDEKDYGHDRDAPWSFDAFGHLVSWYTYKIPDSFEGRDDITALKLLRPHQCDTDSQSLVFGTASGQLTLLSWSIERGETLEQHYDTVGRSVGSLSVSTPDQPLLAATLGDSSLALYSIGRDHNPQGLIPPFSEVLPVIPGARNGRIWSCNFLSDEKVTVGLGPSYEPVQVFEITPNGYMALPLRTFNLESKFWKGVMSAAEVPRNTSVYPTLAIPGAAQGGSDAGHTFLSGGYDGIIRLHDMRSPRGFETMFWDQTNDSSIYSLAAQGLERVVAGVSMHSMIKVFDLRCSGSHAYYTTSIASKPKDSTRRPDAAYNAIVSRSKGDTGAISGGWNLYLNPRNPPKRNAYREEHWRNREDSPVYSLSIPSSTSPNIYTGLEGTIQSLTFHSIADEHPDPVLSQSIVLFADSGNIDVRASYNPHGDALTLGMYEQGNEKGLGMQLLVQDGVTTGIVKNKQRRDAAHSKGLDERWRDLRDDGDRWARGGIPQGPRRGGGHGRGRGRGGRGRGGSRGRGA